MLTPDERYQLQQTRDALSETESAVFALLHQTRNHIRRIDRMLDLGPNPHFPLAPPYVTRAAALAAQQMKAAAKGPVCTCDFGWQPDCPRHRDTDAAYTDDHQDERPPVRPDGSPRHWPVCPMDHAAGEWCPTTPPDIVAAFYGFRDREIIGTIGQEPTEGTSERPAGPPTPRDLFGR